MDPFTPIEETRFILRTPGPARELGVGVVYEVPYVVDSGHPHQRWGRIGDPPEPLLAFAYRSLGQPLFGDIIEDDADALRFDCITGDPRHVIDCKSETTALGMFICCGKELALAGKCSINERLALGIILVTQDLAH